MWNVSDAEEPADGSFSFHLELKIANASFGRSMMSGPTPWPSFAGPSSQARMAQARGLELVGAVHIASLVTPTVRYRSSRRSAALSYLADPSAAYRSTSCRKSRCEEPAGSPRAQAYVLPRMQLQPPQVPAMGDLLRVRLDDPRG
jgi:hypothetical protein